MPRMKDDEAMLRAELSALEAAGQNGDVLATASKLGIQPGRAANLAKTLGYGQFSYDQRSQAMRLAISEYMAQPAPDDAPEGAQETVDD